MRISTWNRSHKIARTSICSEVPLDFITCSSVESYKVALFGTILEDWVRDGYGFRSYLNKWDILKYRVAGI